MQQVISAEEAKKITKGRTPNVPVEYETAVRALAECVTLDEAKYWDNKADALAAWAKIYRNDQVGRQAKMLKLHAHRRMGEIAIELRPPGGVKPREPHVGSGAVPAGKGVSWAPGPASLLREQGLSEGNAWAAYALAKLDKPRFEKALESGNSPSVVAAALKREKRSDAWNTLVNPHAGGVCLRGFSYWLRKHSAKKLACQLNPDETKIARAIVTEITEWLDEFEQHLPK